jgi:prophage regulatory protein
MAHKILRLPDVLNRVGFSRSTIYAFVSKGRFPAPVKIGARAVGWLDTDIDQWIGFQFDPSRRVSTTGRAKCRQHSTDGGAK